MNKNRKFKLIKEYPFSPKLGCIIEEKEDNRYYPITEPGGWFSGTKHIIPFSEFWQEIKKEFLFEDYYRNKINKGDSYYCISSDFKFSSFVEIATACPNKGWITFKKKEDRDYYIIMNKPCLSLNDVGKIYVTANTYNPNFPDNNNSQCKRLYNLAKSKLGL